jgi:hypothetical protein
VLCRASPPCLVSCRDLARLFVSGRTHIELNRVGLRSNLNNGLRASLTGLVTIYTIDTTASATVHKRPTSYPITISLCTGPSAWRCCTLGMKTIMVIVEFSESFLTFYRFFSINENGYGY